MAKQLHGTRLADQLLRRVVSVPKEKVEERIAQKKAARLAVACCTVDDAARKERGE